MSSTIPQTSEACCSIPAVQSSSSYKTKGTTIKMGDYDEVYTTGDEKSTTAVVAIFDIFGFYPQTKQGADLLAEALGARVIMPDVFFGGKVAFDKYPPKDEADKQVIRDFFNDTANPDGVLPKVKNLAKLLREGGVTKLYLYGLCWGGKIATLSGSQTIEINGESIPPFDAVAALHPAMMSAKDGKNLLVPIAIYASKDEPVDEFKKMADELGAKPFASKNAYRVYSEMHHGWAGARADLEKEDNLRDFTDVYGRLATFFKNAGEA